MYIKLICNNIAITIESPRLQPSITTMQKQQSNLGQSMDVGSLTRTINTSYSDESLDF